MFFIKNPAFRITAFVAVKVQQLIAKATENRNGPNLDPRRPETRERISTSRA